MKKIYIIILFFSVTFLAIADILNEDGKAARTGAPGEFDCTGCHTSFAVNAGPGSISITSPNLTNWQYIPGQTYQIDVTVAHTGKPLFGFGFESLRTSNNTNAGAFAITNNTETQLKSATVSGTPRSNVVHKQNGGLTNDAHTFSFNWTAPSTNIGNIRFWTAGNASDNQGDTLGDYVYKTSQLVTPFVTGINEVDEISYLSVSPNPAGNHFELRTINFNKGDLVWVSDIHGKIVFSKEMELSTNIIRVNSSAYSNGVYMVSYRSGGKTKSSKVLVVK